MRVITGLAKGHPLKVGKGPRVRPTSDRTKESLFNVFAARVPGCNFLDLCAGAGGVGIEALSRGAARVVFVDQSGESLGFVRENLLTTRLQTAGEHELLRADANSALRLLAGRGQQFDLVFIDPPYGQNIIPPALALLAPVLAADAWAVGEHHRRDPMPETAGDLRRFRQLVIGETVLSFYAVPGPADADMAP